MSISTSHDLSIDYPESDGKPIGETDWHIEWILRLRQLLKYRYRDQRVYVASDLLLHYHEGVPRDFVVPDGFVVLDCDPRARRIFKTWQEGCVPNVVFEFTSASSRRNDAILKPRVYAEIGVQEYFIYDPTREYLSPPLQGYRLIDGEYQRLAFDEDQRLECRQLDLTLEIQDEDLLIRDATTGEPILSETEATVRMAEAGAREAELIARKAELIAQEAEASARRAWESAREAEESARELEHLRQQQQLAQQQIQHLRDELARRDQGS